MQMRKFQDFAFMLQVSEEVGQQFAETHGSNFDQSRLRKAILLQVVSHEYSKNSWPQ